MFKNLPKKISLDTFSKFDFGDVEAMRDNLLNTKECVCLTEPLRTFIEDEANVATGDKGSGKTAAFKLLRDGLLKFSDKPNGNPLLIPISDEYDYKTVKSKIIKQFDAEIDEVEFKLQAAWEIYILYRLFIFAKKRGYKSDEVLRHEKKFLKLFPDDENNSFMEVFGKLRFQVGCKVYQQPGTDMLFPDFYIKPEGGSPQSEAMPNINISECKTALQSAFAAKGKIAYVVFDKLDEFVIGEEYETQKKVLQGLIACISTYSEYKNISLKIFLRNDLFKRIDLSKSGVIKTQQRTVDLVWRDVDIFQFVGQRVAYNIIKNCKISRIEINIGNRSWLGKVKNWVCSRIGLWHLLENESTRSDEVYKALITCLFPKVITHRNSQGKPKDVDIFKFISSHFKTSSGSINPRLVVMFLNRCLKLSVEIHRKDLSKDLSINNDGEYELIKRKAIERAYYEVQNAIWEEAAETDHKWLSNVRKLNEKKQQSKMTYGHMKSILGFEDENELRSFLSYMTHLGVLTCLNQSDIEHDKRSYELPIVYKMAFYGANN